MTEGRKYRYRLEEILLELIKLHTELNVKTLDPQKVNDYILKIIYLALKDIPKIPEADPAMMFFSVRQDFLPELKKLHKFLDQQIPKVANYKKQQKGGIG